MSLGNLVPRINNTGSLGTATKQWNAVYAQSFFGDGSGLTGVIAEWDGSHSGSASITGSLTVSGSDTSITTQMLQFDTTYSSSGHIPGRMYWNNDEKTINLEMSNPGVTLQLGQEEYLYARNVSGGTILNGDVVRIVGATGNKITIDKAISSQQNLLTTDTNEIIGIATEDINNNQLGYITTFGTVRDIDTSLFTEGTVVYVSNTTSGSLSPTKPPAPYSVIKVGIVERSHPTLGTIFVKPSEPIHMNDITGITGSNIPTGMSYWQYDSATGITSLVDTITGSFIGDGSGLTGVTATSTPGGPNTSIQFNKSGSTSGSADLTYDYDSKVLNIQSGIKHKTTRVTSSSYIVQQSDYRVGVKYSTTGSCIIQLPLISETTNQEFKFKDEEGNASLNPIFIVVSGSNLIDGQTTGSIDGDYHAINIYNDGINGWFIE